MTDTTLADLYAQRRQMLTDIESACESHGLPVEVINDLVANRLPAIEAAITDAEANLDATTNADMGN
jgi:hypothetical protein